MNKKVMALAVASAFVAPAAFAQSSNVQLYGRAVVGIDNYAATGSSNQNILVPNASGPGNLVVSVPGSAIDYKARNRIFDNSSRVGVRGTEDLGNGLKAIFQIESGVAIDSGQAQGAGGVANASKGTWASRDSFAGIDSNFGRLTFGRQSIYWANGELAQFAANYINTEIPWTNGTNLGRISYNGATGAAISVARQSNTMQYTTPTFFGLNATVSYSPNSQENVQHNSCVLATNGAASTVTVTGLQSAPVQGLTTISGASTLGAAAIPGVAGAGVLTGTGCAVGTGANTNGQIWGATVRGSWGAFLAQFDWAQNDLNSPIVTSNPVTFAQVPANGTQVKWTGYKGGVGWKYMPGSLISFIWVQSKNNNALSGVAGAGGTTLSGAAIQAAALGNTVTQNGYTINWEQTLGNFQILAQYGWLDAMKGCNSGSILGGPSCNDTKATAYMVGARYFLSKRTWLFASFNQVRNQQNQFSDFTGDSYTSVANNGALLKPYGADPTVWGAGIFHAF